MLRPKLGGQIFAEVSVDFKVLIDQDGTVQKRGKIMDLLQLSAAADQIGLEKPLNRFLKKLHATLGWAKRLKKNVCGPQSFAREKQPIRRIFFIGFHTTGNPVFTMEA